MEDHEKNGVTNSCCQDHQCFYCCIDTHMPLSNKDVERIKGVGFSYDFFVKVKNGFLQLKNRHGRCVFHDGVHCLIYRQRPSGCTLYPVIFDKEENCAVVDEECPFKDHFILSDMVVKQLFDLVNTIECERAQRSKKKG